MGRNCCRVRRGVALTTRKDIRYKEETVYRGQQHFLVGPRRPPSALSHCGTRFSVTASSVSWLAHTASKLNSVGEVEQVSILPLVEHLTSSHEYRGEPGVSYLLRADRTTLLFDAGLNARGKDPIGAGA
jgi:hypothetical protein